MKETIYCTNCENCKIIRKYNNQKTTYVKMIRCEKYRWLNCSGDERIFDYHNLLNRRMRTCAFYNPMCENKKELKAFIKELRNALPRRRIIYTADTNSEVNYG